MGSHTDKGGDGGVRVEEGTMTATDEEIGTSPLHEMGDRTNKLTVDEIKEIGADEGVQLDQGMARPLFLVSLVDTDFGKKKFVMECDSGSDRSIITKRECDRLGLRTKVFKERKDVTGVGGGKIYCSNYCILKMLIRTKAGKVIRITLLT